MLWSEAVEDWSGLLQKVHGAGLRSAGRSTGGGGSHGGSLSWLALQMINLNVICLSLGIITGVLCLQNGVICFSLGSGSRVLSRHQSLVLTSDI